MNPVKADAKSVEVHDETFWIGDRVLQLQNNPTKDIYNGQIGQIIGLQPENKQETATVDFDGRQVSLSKNDLFDITHAYAITIHKAQGSEFPVVILALTMQNYIMLRRNLLYTGITRAEQILVLVGDPQAFALAVKTPGNARQTGLVAQIRRLLQAEPAEETADDEAYVLTPAKIKAGTIDPMIGMDGIKLSHQKEEA
jgi:exodeoxyribonuclease V alpha subunit